MGQSKYLSALLLILLCTASPAMAKDVEEKFDDGTVHLRYKTDAKDRKNGDYQEFFQGGKTHIHGSYTADKKSGAWTTFNEAGKTLEVAHYQNDQLDGLYQVNFASGQLEMRTTYHNGTVIGPVFTFTEKGAQVFTLTYPMPWETVLKAWTTWNPTERKGPRMLEEPSCKAPFKAGRMADESQQSALKYMMLYRFMSGVPVTNMSIDPTYADKCQHGAVILNAIGHLSHTPEQPAGMESSFYKTGYAGTSSSNISQGRDNLFDSIDDYMDDSDTSNIDRVGHRQWILNPGMQKTAFGYADRFSTLYSFDGSNTAASNWTFISYPGPGFYPHSMLRDDAAWSISLNTQKCKIGAADTLTITISALDERYAIIDTSTATIVNIAKSPNGGMWPCVIFKPNIKKPGVGKYVVTVGGIKTTTGSPAPLTYLVDVLEMPEKTAKP